MLDFNKDALCVGCTACFSACPVKAINMVQSDHGFYISAIDEEKCISCGGCERVCPVLKNNYSRDFASVDCEYAYCLNEENRLASSSGGIFYELAQRTIFDGGIVCGCLWNEDFVAHHVCSDDIEIVNQMRLSKYVQSNLENCFSEIKDYIKHRKVMFIGTPCQAIALHAIVGESDNLLICAVVCGGVPSPEVWRLYKDAVEQKAGSKIKTINMRTKARSWLLPSIEINFTNGKQIIEVLTQNLYGASFYKGLQILEACMQCTYKLDCVEADIIMGDHWGIDPEMLKKSRDSGVSSVMLLTDKGKDAFEAIKPDLFSVKGNVAEVVSSHHVLTKQHEPNTHRNDFFHELHNVDIMENLQRFLEKPKHGTLKRILFKTKMYEPFYKTIWMYRHK